MTGYSYGIYFDKWELEVDRNGTLLNPEVLYIVEFECDDETGEIITTRRIDANYKLIENEPDLSDLMTVGYDDDATVKEAQDRFYQWLEMNTAWKQVYAGSYYEPKEWVCVGIAE